MDMELSYYTAKSYGILDVVLKEMESCSEFTFNDLIEIQDILQKDETVFFTVPRNYVREWFVRKIQQKVNNYSNEWFEEQMK